MIRKVNKLSFLPAPVIEEKGRVLLLVLFVDLSRFDLGYRIVLGDDLREQFRLFARRQRTSFTWFSVPGSGVAFYLPRPKVLQMATRKNQNKQFSTK